MLASQCSLPSSFAIRQTRIRFHKRACGYVCEKVHAGWQVLQGDEERVAAWRQLDRQYQEVWLKWEAQEGEVREGSKEEADEQERQAFINSLISQVHPISQLSAVITFCWKSVSIYNIPAGPVPSFHLLSTYLCMHHKSTWSHSAQPPTKVEYGSTRRASHKPHAPDLALCWVIQTGGRCAVE